MSLPTGSRCPMVIIFGHPLDDPCVAQTFECIRDRGGEVVLIEPWELIAGAGFNWSLSPSSHESFFTLGSQKIPFHTISGVLARIGMPGAMIPAASGEEDWYIRRELQAALRGILSSLDCPVIHRPFPELRHGPALDGVERLKRATECGWRLAGMLLTSSPESAAQFYDRARQRILLGTGSGGSAWRLLQGAEGKTELLDQVARSPVSLHEVPGGTWIQAFIVGERVLGALVSTEEQGAGNGPVIHRSIDLSPALQQRCSRLAQAFHLEFAQIDLILNEEHEAYGLEISPFPRYDRCEAKLQTEITAALAERLEHGSRGSVA